MTALTITDIYLALIMCQALCWEGYIHCFKNPSETNTIKRLVFINFMFQVKRLRI